MTAKDDAKLKLAALIEKFNRLDDKRKRAYNESEVCKDFILPMFAILGWDTQDSAEVAAEVLVGKTYADYGFKLDGVTRFFLEAKSIKADLENVEFARQAVSYAWSKGIPWAILTDFEGLKLFNAEWDLKDVNRLRVLDLTVDQYLEKFDDLWALSRSRVKEDGIRKAFESRGGAVKKALPVGEQLFGLFKQWRVALLTMFQHYNTDAGYRLGQIDEAVQRVLDRLIFIRTLEDRNIENPILLEILHRRKPNGVTAKVNGDDAWVSLQAAFRWLDDHYDSNLFRPHLADKLRGDESVILPVLSQLYSPNGAAFRFDFRAIESDVLGQVYEQYLGHVAQTIKIEIKRNGQSFIPGMEPATPDVVELVSKQAKRKQQGIYYTPKFVVDYLVEQTLGRLLEERGGDEKWLETLTVLDPACGSGSFLIAAYERLLKHYAEVRQLDGPGLLDQDERVDILTRHIYGVDLDPQAVEIARLNLVLRALDRRQRLPELDRNIIRGNSLISGTEETLQSYFGPNWADGYPLNWHQRFPQIMGRGGFDAIIGNPPYIRAENMSREDRMFWQQSGTFEVVYGRFDIFILFVERGITLSREKGRLGFIIPDALLSQKYGKLLRQKILNECRIESVVDLSEYKVFEQAQVATDIIVLESDDNRTSRDNHYLQVISQPTYVQGIRPEPNESSIIRQSAFSETPDNMFRLGLTDSTQKLIRRIETDTLPFGSICIVITGVVAHDSQTGASKDRLINASAISERSRPYIEAKDLAVTRYAPINASRFIEYIPEAMHRSKFPELFESPKLLVQDIIGPSGLLATLDTSQVYTNHSFNCCVLKSNLVQSDARLSISEEDALRSQGYDLRYLLAIVNSSLMSFYFRTVLGGKMHASPVNVKRLPIHAIDTSNPGDVEMQRRIASRAQSLLDHHALLDKLGFTDERTDVERRIEQEEKNLDLLIYDLYGLTSEEIAIVESQT